MPGWAASLETLGGGRVEGGHTRCKFTDMPFVRSVKDVPYTKLLAHLLQKLRTEGLTSTAADLDL